MPIYEFVCADCGKPFEMLVLYSSRAAEATCPDCHSQNVTKKISSFASRLSGVSSLSLGSSSSSSCDTGSV